jgi:uncharacterized protein YbaP (TraB family)
MTRFALLFSFLILFSFHSLLLAQSKNLLWQIQHPEIESPSYLFGTIHALCLGDFILPETVKEKLQKSRNLVLEINLAEVNVGSMNPSLMIIPDGKTLIDFIDSTSYIEVQAFAKENLMMDIQMIQRIKPIFLSSMLLPKLLGCNPTSIESLLMGEAQKNNLSLAGLETMESQFEVLSALSMEMQVEYLLSTIRDIDLASEELKNLITLYKQEEIEQMYALIQDSELQTYEAALLSDRNEDWIPKMEKMMQESITFFAVGAGHLAGERGVIRLLEAQGYTLTPIALEW